MCKYDVISINRYQKKVIHRGSFQFTFLLVIVPYFFNSGEVPHRLKIESSLFNCRGISETVCENRLNMLDKTAIVNRKLKPGFIRIFFNILTQNSSTPKLQHSNIYDSSDL